MNFWVHKDEKDFGPYTREEIVSFRSQGVFSNEDSACEVGLSNWSTIGELFPLPKPPVLPNPPSQNVKQKAEEEFIDEPVKKKKIIYLGATLLAHRNKLRNNSAYPTLRGISIVSSIAFFIIACFIGSEKGGEKGLVLFGLVGLVVAIFTHSVTSIAFDVADACINTSKNSETQKK